jgi:hypothetical protein
MTYGFRFQAAQLPTNASDREKRVAEQYVRLAVGLPPRIWYHVELHVGHQDWRVIEYCDDEETANWHAHMLAIALTKIQDERERELFREKKLHES